MNGSRLKWLWCWIKTGHKWDKTGDSIPMGDELNTCTICGKANFEDVY
jgi:hypothetical protein